MWLTFFSLSHSFFLQFKKFLIVNNNGYNFYVLYTLWFKNDPPPQKKIISFFNGIFKYTGIYKILKRINDSKYFTLNFWHSSKITIKTSEMYLSALGHVYIQRQRVNGERAFNQSTLMYWPSNWFLNLLSH